jgi:hypothetical protein
MCGIEPSTDSLISAPRVDHAWVALNWQKTAVMPRNGDLGAHSALAAPRETCFDYV